MEAPVAFGAVVGKLYENDEVVNAQIVAVNEAGDTAQILVTPRSGPTDPATMDLVQSIRDGETELNEEFGLSYGVTGQTALEATSPTASRAHWLRTSRSSSASPSSC